MNYRKCAMLAAASWAWGIFGGLGLSVLIFTLPFCGSKTISHFFCDLILVLRLASTNTYEIEMAISTLTVLADLILFLLILYSYILIISTIFLMPVAKSRHKAFSTCSSHLTVVCIFYGTIIFTYIHPNWAYSEDSDRILALLYIVVTTSLNPIIYSLRNKETKAAFMKSVGKKQIFRR
ncbi:olfactory receptor 10C1-like [Crotalus tigris]|uniref:olfactory receptor 10C1-like n=1 Tax=Crotalus tigris TaxID=88082 RepID=UPI00192FAB1E|nr:olfactory receptor 10C1-like [Crotalus tigris]